LYSFLYPDFAEELVNGFVEQYRAGGWIARWSSPGYANLMTGTSSDASFAESYIAGAISTDLALEAYDAAVRNATVLPTSDSVGRKGLDTSQFLGYTSTATGESVSWGLEGYINDYAIGKMAEKLAADPETPAARVGQLKEEATYFLKRSDDAVNAFDSAIGFFQGRSAAGDFSKSPASYDSTSWGGDYTETNGWNFAFHMPQDVDGLAALYGGQDGLIEKLETFFTTQETGTYGIHEAKEARDVRIGQFGMSNQVSHHIPYIAAAAGEPSLTQEVVREVLQRLFVGSENGQGYPGDEDNGEMSSWYIFSALGFYPLALGSDDYVIGSPLFDKAIVHRGDDTLTVVADGNTKATPYVSGVKLDGSAQDSVFLAKADLSGDHTLTFQMSDDASNWGSTPDSAATRTPLVDATSEPGSVLAATETAGVSALADNNSRTAVTLAAEAAELVWTSTSGPVQVATYTLTNGSSGSAPASWKLEGSNDGSAWTTVDERSDQEFTWKTQTRPFSVAEPGLYLRYRLAISSTSDGGAARLAEIELLADPTSQGDLEIHAQSGTARTGVAYAGAYAVVRGGSTDASDYQATVDFLDGEGPQAATVSSARLGGVQVKLPHTFAAAGSYPIVVAVAYADGSDVVNLAVNGLVAVTTGRTFADALDSACLTTPGTAVDCDGNGYGLSKTALAAAGFTQGSRTPLAGTDLTFVAPVIADGQADNASANGQVIRLDTGAGAQQLAFVGFGNEGSQSGTGTITYADGSTQQVTIAFGDWVGASSSPISGNTVVAKVSGRLQGTSGSDSKATAIYATTPIDLKQDTAALTLTLPDLDRTVKQGQLHVFAIADDGDHSAAVEALKVTAGTLDEQVVGREVSAALAAVTGGLSAKVATVYWGDGTPTDIAEVTDGAVQGSHTYLVAGDYTAIVTVDDGSVSRAVEVPVTVVPAYQTAIELSSGTAHGGSAVAVTGTG
ncbi:MAG: glycoside hydrolase family 92 protein, partial [Propionicimonas sp.]